MVEFEVERSRHATHSGVNLRTAINQPSSIDLLNWKIRSGTVAEAYTAITELMRSNQTNNPDASFVDQMRILSLQLPYKIDLQRKEELAGAINSTDTDTARMGRWAATFLSIGTILNAVKPHLTLENEEGDADTVKGALADVCEMFLRRPPKIEALRNRIYFRAKASAKKSRKSVSPTNDKELREIATVQKRAKPERTAHDLAILARDTNHVLGMLPFRYRTVLGLHYGLEGRPSYTLEAAGKILEISKERVRQLEKRAVRELQKPANAIALEQHVLHNYKDVVPTHTAKATETEYVSVRSMAEDLMMSPEHVSKIVQICAQDFMPLGQNPNADAPKFVMDRMVKGKAMTYVHPRLARFVRTVLLQGPKKGGWVSSPELAKKLMIRDYLIIEKLAMKRNEKAYEEGQVEGRWELSKTNRPARFKKIEYYSAAFAAKIEEYVIEIRNNP